MQSLRNFFVLLFWTAFVGLLHYELVATSPGTVLGPLPGSAAAAYVEKFVLYQPRTGFMPIDRLLH